MQDRTVPSILSSTCASLPEVSKFCSSRYSSTVWTPLNTSLNLFICRPDISKGLGRSQRSWKGALYPFSNLGCYLVGILDLSNEFTDLVTKAETARISSYPGHYKT